MNCNNISIYSIFSILNIYCIKRVKFNFYFNFDYLISKKKIETLILSLQNSKYVYLYIIYIYKLTFLLQFSITQSDAYFVSESSMVDCHTAKTFHSTRI